MTTVLTGPLSWHSRAKCALTHEPESWTTPGGSGDKHVPLKLMRALEACELCPVASECAQQALDEQPIGVVMAGVPLPVGYWWQQSYRAGYRSALERIASGEPMHEVVADELCDTKLRRRLVPLIHRRAAMIRRGATLFPTPLRVIPGGHL